VRFKYKNRYRNVPIHEDEDIEDEIVDDVEDVVIEDQLFEIGEKLGYDFTASNGSGSFSISDNVEVRVRFTPRGIMSIQTVLLKNPARYDCTKNTTTVDNISVELQTCVLIIKEIKSKLM